MRCSFYCIAKEIDLRGFAKSLEVEECRFLDDVLYVQMKISTSRYIDIICFKFGSIIFWGSNEDEERAFLNNHASKFSCDLLQHPSFDLLHYRIDETYEKTFIEEEENQVVLHKDSLFIKLSISHALAQSAKLNVLESSVDNLLAKTTPIHQELEQTGSISLSKKEISKKIGMLFSERYSMNLHSDILDTPEFFWRKPKYEPLYLATAEFQDIQIRHNILHRRLNAIHELYSMLSNELNYINSSRMEIIIIVLIACEVLLGISNHGLLGRFL